MSADNYYVIKLDSNKKFVPVMGFESDDYGPEITDRDPRFDTFDEAYDYAEGDYAEYGVQLSAEVRQLVFGSARG
jgi:hypothetical protein